SPLDLAGVAPNFFYFSDSGNHRIRCVVQGVVLSVAGAGHPAGSVYSSGSGQPKTSSETPPNSDRGERVPTLSVPAKMTIAPDGGLYFCDRGNRSIRHLNKDGKMETLALRTVSKNVPSESKSSQVEKEEAK
ncbi:MAG: hypothetical protein ABL921_15610, partial [Pirellula sp.]